LKRKSRGLGIIILLIIVIIIAFLGFVVIFGMLRRGRAAPIVEEAFWKAKGHAVESVTLGEEVEAHVIVKATEEYVGSLVVKIRKDIALWSDRDYQLSTVLVNLRAGEIEEIQIAFVPDESTDGRFRGYFVEIEFRVTGTSWVMENSYPPRLRVLA
jgi:hypothetical protein